MGVGDLSATDLVMIGEAMTGGVEGPSVTTGTALEEEEVDKEGMSVTTPPAVVEAMMSEVRMVGGGRAAVVTMIGVQDTVAVAVAGMVEAPPRAGTTTGMVEEEVEEEVVMTVIPVLRVVGGIRLATGAPRVDMGGEGGVTPRDVVAAPLRVETMEHAIRSLQYSATHTATRTASHTASHRAR